MSIDQRAYHRIFTEIDFSIGSSKKAKKQVNISANGIAFIVDKEYEALAVEGAIIEVNFSIFGIEFERLTVRIVRVIESIDRLMVGATYIGVPKSVKDKVDRAILDKGGYQADDKLTRAAYLSWYAPHLLDENQDLVEGEQTKTNSRAEDFLAGFVGF